MSLTIGLVGNPNCGKTTIFNKLTGRHQRVGNWPGVTVERKSGKFTFENTNVEVIDLPGIYSLINASHASIDEAIASEFILNREADVIVNILDANNLERNLYLTAQLLEMQVPIIIAVNMLDVARNRQIQIAVDVLEKELGCPVVTLEAHKGKGLTELKAAIIKKVGPIKKELNYPELIKNAIQDLTQCLHKTDGAKEWLAIRLLEGDIKARETVSTETLFRTNQLQHQISEELGEDADILLADTRYRFIHDLVSRSVIQLGEPRQSWTLKIDKIILNRILGIPIFLFVMYSLFLFSINIGGVFQDFFDITSETIFVEGVSHVLNNFSTPHWLVALLAHGIGKGINTTLTFIPVIGAMFLALAFLEDSGYMARAAFVVDRLMRALGLPGKSFVPMIVGFGCNVPSVMGARTLENKRDRILTVMMSPFMSCGARLAIFAVFTAAFFPVGGQNIVFALYLIGIGMAMLTGLLLRKTLLQGDPAPLVMELPPYHMPRFATVGLLAWQRLKAFVFRAGKLIIPICVFIGLFNTLNTDGSLRAADADAHSMLSAVGQWLTPIFSPMGITQNNWPATVGLLTGVLAKEVVIGTLNSLYSQVGHLASLPSEVFNFWGSLYEAVISIPKNLSEIGHSLGNPILAKAPMQTLDQSVYGIMYQRFDGKIGAMAYLLFVLLYIPCVSTAAAMLRELNRKWAFFSIFWTTLIAYGTAVCFYQMATFSRHPATSSLWVMGIAAVFFTVVIVMRLISRESKKGGFYELARN